MIEILILWLFAIVSVELAGQRNRRLAGFTFARRCIATTLLTTIGVEALLALAGPAHFWLHMVRFDTDGNGFIEAREVTPTQVADSDLLTADTWQFGLAVATPIVLLCASCLLLLSQSIINFVRSRGAA
jgi:hypothetical protein